MQYRMMQSGRQAHCFQAWASSNRLFVQRRLLCRKSSFAIRAARSSGAEEREQALRQQWQEAAPEEQSSEGNPYGGSPYGNGSQYYQQYPAYPQYGAPPEPKGGIPWGWVVLGGVVAIVVSKVLDFLSPSGGGPQAKMMSFMMKQAMKGAGGAGGGANVPPGFPDFSKLGAPPGMPGGFPGSGFPSSPASNSSQKAASSPIVDTQARTVTPGSSSPAPASETAETSKPGAKFEEMKAQSRRRRRGRDGDGTSQKAAFQDVDQEETASSSSAGPSGAAQADRTGPAPGSSAEEDDSASMQMLEQFMQDPNMQQLLYQYLPEPMRNKETFEWMLKNPEYRAQLQSMLKAQGAQLNPEVYKHMQGIDNEEVTRQLAEHGMTPSDVIQKIMGEPELAAAFSKPQVQQAIMELQSNPMAMLKYQDDPDVMLVFEKMSQMFPQMAERGPGAAAGGSSP